MLVTTSAGARPDGTIRRALSPAWDNSPAPSRRGDWTSFGSPVSEEESGAGLKGRGAEKDRRWTISGASRRRSARLKAEGRYRTFANLERDARRFPMAQWRPAGAENDPREVTVWCSNDYLGMGGHPDVIEASVSAARAHGAGAGGTRNISGTHNPIVELEAELADLHGKKAALAFTSGWISNLAAISTIAGLLPNCLILSDALNHNSMIEGVKRSGCEKRVWRHNDVAHLEELLAAEPIDRAKLIVFESLYSMDGDIAPIADDRGAGREVQRPDLYRRSACGRPLWAARRRVERARGARCPHRRHRGHARQGLRLARRLYRGERGDRRRGEELSRPRSSSPRPCRRASPRAPPPPCGI